MSLPVDIGVGVRFFRSVPGFLRRRITGEAARAGLRRRHERQQADFLDLVGRTVYGHPGSPYRALLRHAGCELGDLARLVTDDGVEGALRALLGAGVYVTVDELKGRRPIVRGSLGLFPAPADFLNPRLRGHVPARSGGSRSTGTAILMDLDFIREAAEDTRLLFEARGGLGWTHAQWQVPGSGVIARLLECASFGQVPARWFSHVDPRSPGVHPRYRWSARLLRVAGRLGGRSFPYPEHVPVHKPLPIARWMAATLAGGGTPHLYTYVTSAARLCHAARDAGLDLAGSKFMVTGEPLTRGLRAVIEEAGAEVLGRYGIIECGVIGFGCMAAREPDEVHVVDDRHAVVRADTGVVPTAPVGALFLSSLRPTAPLVLLNASMGDCAEAAPGPCGCPVESIGWRARLHTIRSYEKLTAGGMTFLDADVIRVLEEVLPQRFGGRPTDYQLVEDHTGDGSPRLRLLMAPAVGVAHEGAVAEAFLSALAVGSGVGAVMGRAWRDARLVSVERRAPLVTASGKILHLHVQR